MGGMWYLDEQDQYILGIFIRNYGESENSEFDADSPEGKKLQKAITKAFGVDTPQDADPKNTDSKDAAVEMRTDIQMLEI